MHARRSETDLADLLDLALSSPSPTESLRALGALREELAAFEQAQVRRALDAGATFSELARILGISRQAAHRRYRSFAKPAAVAEPVTLEQAPRTITREARAAIEFALDEAARRGAAAVDSEHFLAGIVATADAATTQRLEGLDVTVAALRRHARRGEAATGARRGAGRSLRAALNEGGTLDLDRLAHATLDAADGRARAVLEAIAVPPRAFLAALRVR
jgi:ATP-dependent Clp protease ATP-binding subunit ClpA